MYSGTEVGETIEDGMNREEQRGRVMRTGRERIEERIEVEVEEAEEKQKQKQTRSR